MLGDVFRSVEILSVLQNNSTEAPQMHAQIIASIAEIETQLSQKVFQTRHERDPNHTLDDLLNQITGTKCDELPSYDSRSHRPHEPRRLLVTNGCPQFGRVQSVFFWEFRFINDGNYPNNSFSCLTTLPRTHANPSPYLPKTRRLPSTEGGREHLLSGTTC